MNELTSGVFCIEYSLSAMQSGKPSVNLGVWFARSVPCLTLHQDQLNGMTVCSKWGGDPNGLQELDTKCHLYDTCMRCATLVCTSITRMDAEFRCSLR